MNYPAADTLKINGLSYADWEDEAERLRAETSVRRRHSRKRDLARTTTLLADLGDELEAIDRVRSGLSGPDAIRVDCVRDLLVALQASLTETLRRLEERAAKQND
jgi:hypothetical protein